VQKNSLKCRNRHLAVDDRRHPVRCVARRSGFARLTLKVVNRRNRREAPTIAQAVHIDHRARSRRRFRDCRDEHAATAADQKIAGAGSEAVVLDQRPIVRPNLELPFEVRNYARTMATAERACARPQRIVFGRLRKPKPHMNITAVTPAQMIHAAESADWQRGCQRCARAQMDLYQRVNSSIHPMCVSAPRAGPTHKLPPALMLASRRCRCARLGAPVLWRGVILMRKRPCWRAPARAEGVRPARTMT